MSKRCLKTILEAFPRWQLHCGPRLLPLVSVCCHHSIPRMQPEAVKLDMLDERMHHPAIFVPEALLVLAPDVLSARLGARVGV